MGYLKYIKPLVIASIIGSLAGEIFIWVAWFLLLYFSSYIEPISGDRILGVPFCLILHVRPVVASVVAFSIWFFKKRSNIFRDVTIAKDIFSVVVIIAIVIIWSTLLSTIQLQWSFGELVELYFKPWCSV